jgi:hypothetical protein
MPRFVLLRHECLPESSKPSHWDLMLEQDGALLTWSLAELPSAWKGELANAEATGHRVLATRLADHRLAYLDYEGTVSNGRGHVKRVAQGEYSILAQSDPELDVQLHGETVEGRVRLMHQSGHEWTLCLVSEHTAAKER